MKTSEPQYNLIEEKEQATSKSQSVLFDLLRKWRKSKARELKTEPYMVFPNRTLEELSKSHITQKNQLLNIYGVGKIKFVKYGDELFKILIKSYSSSVENSTLEPIDNFGKESTDIQFEQTTESHKNNVVDRESPIDTELQNILKYRDTDIELKNRKYLNINVDKEIVLRSKAYLKGKLSEIVLRYTLKNSGYNVIRGDVYLTGYLKNKPDYFRDQNQVARVKDCINLCENHFIGLPDFFVYNDNEEFFIEVKSNKADLNENQNKTFSEINKIIPIIIARIIMKFSYKSVGISLEQYASQFIEKSDR